MAIELSPQTIEALAFVISGGSANDPTPPIGIYRSGPQLERFMRGCHVGFQVGSSSRYPALVDCLLDIANGPAADRLLPRIIERAADIRDFMAGGLPEKFPAVIDYLNRFLRLDGLELHRRGDAVKLVTAGRGSPVIDDLAAKADVLDFDTVRRDLDRALASAEDDPEDAVTAACSAIEGMCRSVLVELELGLPAKKDITGLYRAVREALNLAPERSDLPAEIAGDVRKVLSGLATTVEGIGALRTHAGDAHGRERGFRRIDARIARLAIHAASTVAVFVLETWQSRFPAKPLMRH